MKESKGGSSAVLDTCRLMERSGVEYSMSLLALCGFHGKIKMVDVLLKEGAGNNNVDMMAWVPVVFSQQCTLPQQKETFLDTNKLNHTWQCQAVSQAHKTQGNVFSDNLPTTPPQIK